jgi:hypothetical protein
MNDLPKTLPRLLYIGDVPVESSYHGSALLFRLLQDYPSERLRILEAGFSASLTERRLVGVSYARAFQSGQRWLHTRFHRWASSLFSLRALLGLRDTARVVKGFQPEAVITVAHGYSWIAAGAYARQRNLPLHFIVHDDWPRMLPDFPPVRNWVERQFARCYREAVSRLCVSPSMIEEYERRYQVRGTLLYPSRAADASRFSTPPERLGETGRALVFAFGGTINTGGHVQALRDLAGALERINGYLHLYGPISQASMERAGLKRANVRIFGLVPAKDFIPRMRAEVDVLFVPMSFCPADRANMTLCFPSKLTDYTAAGLPILIYGPEYSSAVRWARENPGVAEVVTVALEEHLVATASLLQSGNHRLSLASAALQAGDRYFAHAAGVSVLTAALAGKEETKYECRNSPS